MVTLLELPLGPTRAERLEAWRGPRFFLHAPSCFGPATRWPDYHAARLRRFLDLELELGDRVAAGLGPRS